VSESKNNQTKQLELLAKSLIKGHLAKLKAELGLTTKIRFEIEWSPRMRSTFALCRYYPNAGKPYYVIRLSSVVFTRDTTAFRNTIAHEVAHAVDSELYDGWGHDETWQKVMAALGQEPVVGVSEDEARELGISMYTEPQRRHEYECECGYHYFTGKQRSAIMTKMKCVKCSGILEYTGDMVHTNTAFKEKQDGRQRTEKRRNTTPQPC